jgi:1-acyl-sn-glycerol-3-phosphate acyltransferase
MIDELITNFFLYWPVFIGILLIFFTGICIGAFVSGISLFIFSFICYTLWCLCREIGIHPMDLFVEIAKYMRESFQLIMKKRMAAMLPVEGSFPPEEKPVLYCCHPHGMYATIWFLHFCSGSTGFTRKVKFAVHSFLLRIPVMAQVAELLGCIEATETDIIAALREGYSVALLVGGVKEQMLQIGGESRTLYLKRKGFLHVAKKGRADVVPVYCDAEFDLFEPAKGWFLETFQKSWFLIFGMPFAVCTLDTFKRWVSYMGADSEAVFPTVIGSPISWRLPIVTMKKKYQEFFEVQMNG